MRRVLLEWRGIKIYAYPALLFVGIVVGVVAGTGAAASRGLDPARTYAAMLLLVAPALVGARLLSVAVNWRGLRPDSRRIWRPTGGGAALYGGLVLSFLLSLPLLSALDLPLGAFWDAATITLLTGMILTRVGCLLNGCCAGRPSCSALALNLPDVHGVWRRRLPTQLFEAGVAVALLVASFVVWNHLPFEGALFLMNLAAYGVARGVLESMRDTTRRSADSTVNRTLALGLSALALVIFLVAAQSQAATAWTATTSASAAVAGLSGWYFLLAPVAVLAVLSLFGFIGCHLVFKLETIPLDKLFRDLILDDEPVAWWRLLETDPPTSPDGGEAVPEKGTLTGIYTRPVIGYPPDPATSSIGAPSPTVLNLGVEGLLATDPARTAIEVQGGFVRIPQGASLFQGSFTLEFLVSFRFSLGQPGFVLPILSCREPAARNNGIVLFVGPDPLNPQSYSWQLLAGTGTALVPLAALQASTRPNDPGMNIVGDIPMYLVLSYEPGAAAFSVYYYHAGRDTDFLTYIFPFPAGSGTFVPAIAAADLLIGIDQPPIIQVQSTGAEPTGPSSAGVSLTYTQATRRGHLLVVAVVLNSGGINPVTATISDSFGNTWKQACRSQTAGTNPFSAEIWYAENCLGGANHQITITPSISAFVALASAEYSGVAANALDQTRTNFAGSANPSDLISSDDVTTTIPGALYFGAAQWGGVNLAASTELFWTNLFSSMPTTTTAAISVETFGEIADLPAGNFVATWKLPSPQPWAACLAVFRPAAPNPYLGRVADVVVYDYVLSAERVLAHGLAAFDI